MSKKELNITEVMPEINWIKDDDIRQKTIEIWEQMYKDSKWEDIMDLPCSTHKTDYPHIVHNRSVVQMAVSVADILENMHGVKIDHDNLICAALLQDAAMLAGLPNEVVQAINTHSPDSAVYPQSLIGKILFYVDQTDMAAIKGDRWRKIVYIYR